MSTLILLNGAPASGKSTLAARYAQDHPLILRLDLDLLRSLLGAWSEDASQAGILTRRMALEMARVHLDGGRDVIVPQYLGRLDFILELESLADRTDARFVEVMLDVPLADSVTRFARREDADAVERLARGGDSLDAMHARLRDVVRARPGTMSIRVAHGRIDEAYAALCAAIGRRQDNSTVRR